MSARLPALLPLALCAGLGFLGLVQPEAAPEQMGANAPQAASDEAFARDLWQAMEGYRDWKLASEVYPGTSPHGAFLRLYASWVNVGEGNYPVIVKENFGGEGVTQEMVREKPDPHLGAVTIMLQREEGYDPDGENWFYVKYGKDGSVLKPADTPLAGKVQSCVSCHANAKGGDYLFTNDER